MRRHHPSRAVGLLIVLLGGTLCVQTTNADGITDQQQQVKDDIAEINRLDQKASQLNEQYLGYLNQIDDLNAQIAVSQQQIDKQQADLATMQVQLADLAVARFTGGSGGGIGALIGNPSSLIDGLQRDQLTGVVVNAANVSTDDYDTLLHDLQHEQSGLQDKQAQVTTLAQQAGAASDQATKAGEDYQAELVKDQALLGDLIAQEQQRQLDVAAAQHAKDIAAAQAKNKADAEAAAATAAANAAASGAATGARSSTGIATVAPSSANNNGSGATTTKSSTATASTAASSAAASSAATSSGSSQDGSSPDTSSPDTSSPDTSSPDTSSPTPAADNSGSTDNGGSGNGASTSAATSAATNQPSAPSSLALVAVAAARSQLGVPYRAGALSTSPGVGFDCSGLTQYAYKMAGISIPHQSGQQFATTPHVSVNDIQPGDLLYFYSPISHVSIYIGNGQEIHAPAPGKFVEIVRVDWNGLVGASRPTG